MMWLGARPVAQGKLVMLSQRSCERAQESLCAGRAEMPALLPTHSHMFCGFMHTAPGEGATHAFGACTARTMAPDVVRIVAQGWTKIQRLRSFAPTRSGGPGSPSLPAQ